MPRKERMARKKLANKVDLLKPMPQSVFDFGGDKDPCFGKFNDPDAKECRQCGDCEICAIVQGQKNHKLRAATEAENNFKDIEQEKIDNMSTATKFRKLLHKLAAGKGITINDFKERAMAGLGISEKKFNLYLQKQLDKKPSKLRVANSTITLKP